MKSLSRVRLFATPWTVAYQAPPSMGFSRQECWSGLPFPSPGDLPDLGIEPGSPALRQTLYRLSYQGRPDKYYHWPMMTVINDQTVLCFTGFLFTLVWNKCFSLKKKSYAKSFAPITITLNIGEDIKEKYIFPQVGFSVRKLRLTWTLNPTWVVFNILQY